VVGEVGEPFEFRWQVGEVAELGGGERAPKGNGTGVAGSHQSCFMSPPYADF